jgi:hypothetical protein
MRNVPTQSAGTNIKNWDGTHAMEGIPLDSKWYHPIANAYIVLKSTVAGAKPVKNIFDYIGARTTKMNKKEMVFGVYTRVSARVA